MDGFDHAKLDVYVGSLEFVALRRSKSGTGSGTGSGTK